MVHQGETSNRLWHTRFNDVLGRWSDNVEIQGQLSKAPPALATFDGLLHLIHLGDESNHIWHSTFDGAFAPNIRIPYQLSKPAPALAAFGGRLHMVHLGDTSDDIWHSTSDGVLVRRPDRRVVVIDLDGVRWDTFYRHLKRVRDAGARTDVSYTFVLPPGASDDTVLGDGDVSLHSALGELCFGRGNGMVDVRLALAPYPSFTFPSHATMYTGTSPGQHGITGHTFIVRDAAPEWDRHSWDSLPRAPALQGYCTDADSSGEALADWLWGGFDTVGENSCRTRNRGLVSDLRVANLFERVHEEGLRSCSIHSFYHGALRPWDAEGKDQWWRYSPPELRSVKDACSDEDVDQLETVDHGALIKAELLLEFMPSTVRVQAPANFLPYVPNSADKRSGERRPGWSFRGDAHPDGTPDLIAIYLASIDGASHVDSIRNQETYLAWFDHRLARFVRALREKDRDAFDSTVFAFVTDHGHSRIAQAPDTAGLPSSNVLSVREELVRLLLGESEGQDFLDLARQLSVSYDSMVADAIEDDFGAWAEAMNLYVYIRFPDAFPPIDVARRLLSIPMRTEPYGALVLVDGRYRFLARGERSLVEVPSDACRAVVVPQLDVPPATTEEIDATALSPADADAERALRDRLRTAEAFDLLQVAERVAALQPARHNQSPDVILLAPSERSFTSTPATHGSFAYPTSRIPMVFCGPGIPEGQRSIEGARMIDVAPTILSLLGIAPEGMEGDALLDGSGRIRGRQRPDRPRPERVAPLRPARPRRDPAKRRLPRVTAVLHGAMQQPATGIGPTDEARMPVLVAVTVRSPRLRREVALKDPSRFEARSALAIVSGRDDAWAEVDGERRRLRTGAEIPLAGRRVRIGSKSSYGSLELRGTYLVAPLSIELPRIPGWLLTSMQDLARAGRILIDDGDVPPGSILVPAAEFERIVRRVEAEINGADVPLEQPAPGYLPPLSAPQPSLPDMARVRHAVRILESLLDRSNVASLDAVPGRLCRGGLTI